MCCMSFEVGDLNHIPRFLGNLRLCQHPDTNLQYAQTSSVFRLGHLVFYRVKDLCRYKLPDRPCVNVL